MNAETAYLLIVIIGALAIGGGIGAFISKKTKLLDKFTQDSRDFNKIVNDPEKLIEKIKESAKKLNPEAEGELVIKDRQDIVTLGVKEENGKRVLDIQRKKDPEAAKEIERLSKLKEQSKAKAPETPKETH